MPRFIIIMGKNIHIGGSGISRLVYKWRIWEFNTFYTTWGEIMGVSSGVNMRFVGRTFKECLYWLNASPTSRCYLLAIDVGHFILAYFRKKQAQNKGGLVYRKGGLKAKDWQNQKRER